MRLSTLVAISREISEAQKLAHEAVLVREAKLIREARFLNEAKFLTRLKPVARMLRVVQRTLRLLRARLHIGASAARIYKPGQKTVLSKKKRSKRR